MSLFVTTMPAGLVEGFVQFLPSNCYLFGPKRSEVASLVVVNNSLPSFPKSYLKSVRRYGVMRMLCMYFHYTF